MTRYSEIWTHLHEEGVKNAAEVADKFGMDATIAHKMLRNMAMFGELIRFEKDPTDPKSRISFGIDGDCVTPYGVKLKDILP